MELDQRYLSVLEALAESPKTSEQLVEECHLGESPKGTGILGTLNKMELIAKTSNYVLLPKGREELRRRGVREQTQTHAEMSTLAEDEARKAAEKELFG
jgi:hypothetical protein